MQLVPQSFSGMNEAETAVPLRDGAVAIVMEWNHVASVSVCISEGMFRSSSPQQWTSGRATSSIDLLVHKVMPMNTHSNNRISNSRRKGLLACVLLLPRGCFDHFPPTGDSWHVRMRS